MPKQQESDHLALPGPEAAMDRTCLCDLPQHSNLLYWNLPYLRTLLYVLQGLTPPISCVASKKY